MNFFFIIFISTLFIGCDLNDVNGSVSNEKDIMSSASMDSSINIFPNSEPKRLKPIQCLFLDDSLLVISCSGGFSYNPFTGINDTTKGQVQLWNTESMTIIDTMQFSWNSSPWHLVNSSSDSIE